ncbi:MAG: hypothetical protein KDN05_04335 [Verrucomicrobiae bacterium]|nr:hypothetical protein [Verrucomicrobiae bacterium]
METEKKALHTLTDLGIHSYSTGCPNSDVDTYVNHCAAIANLVHPESRLEFPDLGRTQPIGLNTLTCGPASIAGLDAHVISPVRLIHNRYLRNNAARKATKIENRREGRHASRGPTGKLTDATGAIYNLVPANPFEQIPDTSWSDELNESQIEAEALHRPAVFFDGTAPRRLSQQLASCHLGKALVSLRIESASFAACNGVFRGIRDGVALKGGLPYQASGHVVAASSLALLAELSLANPFDDGIVGGCLWLTGGPLCSESWPARPDNIRNNLPIIASDSLLECVQLRFQGKPVVVKVGTEGFEACASFAEYLHSLEPAMPGISRCARNLLPTLLFGISVLSGCHREKAEPLSKLLLHVHDWLARALARRMADQYQKIHEGDRLERIRQIGRSIQDKLGERPHTVRELTRRFNRLLTQECVEVLQYLEASGAVVQQAGAWMLTTPHASDSNVNLETHR